MKEKCIVLFSGGLDSRLAIKLMQKRGFEVIALFFKLPFENSCYDKAFDFLKIQGIKFKIFDCTKGKLLQEYLKIIRKAKYGTGAGVNPCIDCRIFMLKKAKKFADERKINLVATGEVLGQRPMSQRKRGLEITGKESGLGKRLIRPLSYYGILGRKRDKQIALARKFKIEYPFPAGGCLLCEKELKERLKFLLKRGFNNEEIKLVNVGRHFLIGEDWVVVGKDKEENEIIESVKSGKIIIPDFRGPSAVIFRKSPTTKSQPPAPRKLIGKVNELIKVYSKGNLKDRKKFEKFRL